MASVFSRTELETVVNAVVLFAQSSPLFAVLVAQVRK